MLRYAKGAFGDGYVSFDNTNAGLTRTWEKSQSSIRWKIGRCPAQVRLALNSGSGEIGHVDLDSGRFEPVASCPGYLRGLAFVGDYAVVTLSKPRHDSFHGLELDNRLEQRGAEPQCGLQVIDLNTGTIAHWLRLEGSLVSELYDAVVLPGVRQPMAVGFQTNEIERLMLIGEEGPL